MSTKLFDETVMQSARLCREKMNTPPLAHRVTPSPIEAVTHRRSRGEYTILAGIVGFSVTVGALLASLFSSAGENASPRTLVAGGVEGALIGLGFGLVLALPAAVIVWLLSRGRR